MNYTGLSTVEYLICLHTVIELMCQNKTSYILSAFCIWAEIENYMFRSEGREEERQRDSLTTESSPAPVVSPLTSPRMRQWVTVAQLTWCCLVVSRHLVVKQVRREEESLQSMNIYQFDSYFDVILHSSLKKDIKFRSYIVHNGAWIYRALPW